MILYNYNDSVLDLLLDLLVDIYLENEGGEEADEHSLPEMQ